MQEQIKTTSFLEKLKSVFGTVYPENVQETDEECEENED